MQYRSVILSEATLRKRGVAQSKDPENKSPYHAASGSSHGTFFVKRSEGQDIGYCTATWNRQSFKIVSESFSLKSRRIRAGHSFNARHHLIVADALSIVQLRQSLLHFCSKPLVMVEISFHDLLHKLVGRAAAL
jgi:hypothetical protein